MTTREAYSAEEYGRREQHFLNEADRIERNAGYGAKEHAADLRVAASALRIASRADEETIVRAIHQSVMEEGKPLDGPMARAILRALKG